jgi:hypothetical protein
VGRAPEDGRRLREPMTEDRRGGEERRSGRGEQRTGRRRP